MAETPDEKLGIAYWNDKSLWEGVNMAKPEPAPTSVPDPLATMQINWELHWGPYKGDESECCWQVHRVNGGRNDREWTLIAKGETPRAALEAAALQAEPEQAPRHFSAGPGSLDDGAFLRWIAGRLQYVHGEPAHYDYMRRLRSIAESRTHG